MELSSSTIAKRQYSLFNKLPVGKLAPAMLDDVAAEAIAILEGRPARRVPGSIAQGFVAEVLGEMGYSTPMVFDRLVPLLDWHYWQVRVKAARALGQIRRNIPDVAIKRLLMMRCRRFFRWRRVLRMSE